MAGQDSPGLARGYRYPRATEFGFGIVDIADQLGFGDIP